MQSGTRIGTNDVARAKSFYDEIAQLLDAEIVCDMPDVVAYQGPQGSLFAVGTPFDGQASTGNGNMVSFLVPDRALVSKIYNTALALGATSEGAPRAKGDTEAAPYGGYFRDLDGNKLAVFCMSQ